jgi:hypothetical protein
MGAAGFIGLGIFFLTCLPFITSRFAKRMGRDPLKWFLIGILLPGIATFIILFLPDLSDKE